MATDPFALVRQFMDLIRPMRSVRVGDATVTYTPDGALTIFDDGTSYGAQPHDTPHYHVIAHRCGYGDDLLRYAREHEVCHLIVEREFLDGRPSVLRELADGWPAHPDDAAMEEAMVMTLQRWLRANERPIIGGVEWDRIKRDALALLDAA